MYYLLGFGSNIDPETNFIAARQQLGLFATIIAVSPALRTETVGNTFHFPFKNQIVLIQCDLLPNILKLRLQRIETALGREPKNPARKEKDRTIDIDILTNAKSAKECLIADLEDSYNHEVKSLWLTQQPDILTSITETSVHTD